MTDDKSDVPAAAEFLMTNDCRVGNVSTVYVLPVLRTDTEDAAIASNCVLNTGAFGGDDEFIHT